MSPARPMKKLVMAFALGLPVFGGTVAIATLGGSPSHADCSSSSNGN